MLQLTSRRIIQVTGADSTHFLHNLLTNSIENMETGDIRYAALLTPQGKIISDMFVHAHAGCLWLDLPQPAAAEVLKRLTMYRLRAQVTFTDMLASHSVDVGWGGEASGMADPRYAPLGWRQVVESRDTVAAGQTYDAHRIALGIPEGGIDFAYNETFPHEACLDQLHGIDFNKGCYIGQEVVSRMQHRGTARTRIVQVSAAALPEIGTPVSAGGKTVGRMGSSQDTQGIALVRLDRVMDARKAGISIEADGITLELTLPPWASYTWPEEERA
jgi:folate-binding protein YgfZ